MSSNLAERLSVMSPERRQYTVENLAQHLYYAGFIEEGFHEKLAALYQDHAWMKVRFEGSHFTYDGYLEDLALAWESARVKAIQQIETNQEPEAFAD